jgi:hypothetical protein
MVSRFDTAWAQWCREARELQQEEERRERELIDSDPLRMGTREGVPLELWRSLR